MLRAYNPLDDQTRAKLKELARKVPRVDKRGPAAVATCAASSSGSSPTEVEAEVAGAAAPSLAAAGSDLSVVDTFHASHTF